MGDPLPKYSQHVHCMMPGKTGVVICGFGKAGQIHFNGVLANHLCSLKYIVDLVENDSVKANIQSKLDEVLMEGVKIVGIKGFEDEVLQDPEVNAVIVTTPTNEHEFYVRKSLAAGKAVFCEKPIAADLNSIMECYNLAEQVKQPLYCAFNRRFDSGMSSLQCQVKEGKIGTLFHIKTTSRDSPFPTIAYLKTSKGIFRDCAIHDIDLVCWIVGEKPCSVFAQASAFNPEIAAIGDVDTAVIVLKFPSGVLASIDVNRHSQYGYDQRLEVLGSQGMLQVHNVLKEPVTSYVQSGVTYPILQDTCNERYKEAYMGELDHFISVIRDPTIPLCVTKEEVLLVSQITNACDSSLKEGRMVMLEQ